MHSQHFPSLISPNATFIYGHVALSGRLASASTTCTYLTGVSLFLCCMFAFYQTRLSITFLLPTIRHSVLLYFVVSCGMIWFVVQVTSSFAGQWNAAKGLYSLTTVAERTGTVLTWTPSCEWRELDRFDAKIVKNEKLFNRQYTFLNLTKNLPKRHCRVFYAIDKCVIKGDLTRGTHLRSKEMKAREERTCVTMNNL